MESTFISVKTQQCFAKQELAQAEEVENSAVFTMLASAMHEKGAFDDSVDALGIQGGGRPPMNDDSISIVEHQSAMQSEAAQYAADLQAARDKADELQTEMSASVAAAHAEANARAQEAASELGRRASELAAMEELIDHRKR